MYSLFILEMHKFVSFYTSEALPNNAPYILRIESLVFRNCIVNDTCGRSKFIGNLETEISF